jgi:uncharacterized Zn-finger protein
MESSHHVQPQPYAAIELIHKEPVRWTHERIVACDGGGGAAGHPRIFINTDKPEICTCGYCGLPFVCSPPYYYLPVMELDADFLVQHRRTNTTENTSSHYQRLLTPFEQTCLCG